MLAWHGKTAYRVEDVDDPAGQQPREAGVTFWLRRVGAESGLDENGKNTCILRHVCSLS